MAMAMQNRPALCFLGIVIMVAFGVSGLFNIIIPMTAPSLLVYFVILADDSVLILSLLPQGNSRVVMPQVYLAFRVLCEDGFLPTHLGGNSIVPFELFLSCSVMGLTKVAMEVVM